ncbi:MAG: tRNA-intron lyase [Candidatus Micrarchaeia archaeon]
MLELEFNKKKIIAKDESTKDLLKKGFYGTEAKGTLYVSYIEALYLIDSRNAELSSSAGNMSFLDLASKFWKSKKFVARYFAYKDWRDRGLIAKEPDSGAKEHAESTIKKYPAQEVALPHYHLHAVFFKSDLVSVIKEDDKGKELYEKYWFGQYGSYKASDRGRLNKLDIFETVYLLDKGLLSLDNLTSQEVMAFATKRHPDFQSLYDVYADWRDKGYIVKTGFKFGTNFRVYFPGAKPSTGPSKEWMHSKHVIHVFPKNSRLLISEWARAIRVAHSVRKTFLLAVPGSSSRNSASIDFVLYHRHGGEADNPNNSGPRFAMLALGEEEYLGGSDLAAAIAEATRRKLELLLAIVDRETSVTYYTIRRILLPKSQHEYYEIDWLQP